MASLISGKTPANHRRPENPLFLPFNSIFVNTWRIPPSTESVHYAFYVSKPSPPDPDFYKYLNLDPSKPDPLVGEYETDIYRYIGGGGSEVLIILGTVGTGKTTLLKNFDLLCRKYASDRIISILVNFNTQRSAFEKTLATSDESKLKQSAVRYLTDRVLAQLAEHVDSQGDEFWSFAWETSDWFAKYRVRNAIEGELYNTDADWRQARQLEFRDEPEYLTSILRFTKAKLGKSVVVYCDNVDPLPGSTCESILWLAESVCNAGNASVIATMRPNTYNAIRTRIDALNNIRIRMQPASLLEIVRRRTVYARQRIEEATKDVRLQTILRDYRLEGEDAVELFDAMTTGVLSAEIADEIDLLSNQNRRLGFEILISYFRSSFIHTDVMLARMRHLFRNPNAIELDIPTHVVVQAAVAGNYETHFPSENFLPCISNVWHDASFPRPLGYFVQMLALSFFTRCAEDVPVEMLEDCLIPIVEVFETDTHARRSVHRLIERLVKSTYLESPHVLVIDRGGTVPNDGHLRCTQLGQYMLNHLAFRLEYFSYMKDSIDFGSSRPTVASAIDQPSFSGRFEESCRMAEWLVGQEQEMWNAVASNRGAWVHFVSEFSPHDGSDVARPICSGFLTSFQRLIREQPHRIRATQTLRFQNLERTVKNAESRFTTLLQA